MHSGKLDLETLICKRCSRLHKQSVSNRRLFIEFKTVQPGKTILLKIINLCLWIQRLFSIILTSFNSRLIIGPSYNCTITL